MARTPGARTATPQVRIAAVRLVRSGMTRSAVARAFGLDPSTVSRWWRLSRTGGSNALLRRPVPGRPRRLQASQVRQLGPYLKRPPSAVGLAGPRWTLALVADLIRRLYGVSYHPSHVSRLLKDAGLLQD